MTTVRAVRRGPLVMAPVAVAVVIVVGVLAGWLAATRIARAFTDAYVIVHVVPSDPYGLPVPDRLPPGTHAYVLDAAYTLQVDVVPLSLRLFAATGRALAPLALAIGALAVAVLLQLAAGRSTPFVRQAPVLLAVLAVAVALGGVGAPLLTTAAGRAVLTRAGLGEDASVQPLGDANLWWLVVALGILALVPVFIRGRRSEAPGGRSTGVA
jgi:hypothetical protein